ncbi:SRPBCC domain-containing protein [Vallitalea pronyensis]|uniref:SRPBCC domain-containing protein n=1 Tax=Vallitalea pronyensis TaxID=1348613 RepID=A0A8J8SIN8_9FIRM|nr:SRPBCC domain-containing protein [Vallitalea pronyensis]QUI24642.1 SRPBCC domain-containing protein [Vallitalea pronyensis]
MHDNTTLIYLECPIQKDIGAVWKLLSTKEGLKSFFAPDIDVNFKVGGKFEILFDMDQPAGLRGSEGMIILNIEPESMLSFTWNAPPSIPDIRAQMTVVHIYLEPTEDGCLLKLINSGYGKSESWQKARRYFIRAWGDIVLPRLKKVAEEGTHSF